MPCAQEWPSFRPRRSSSSVCGICGVAFAARSTEAESRVRAMTAALRHRGPDEEGFLTGDQRAPGLALGMRRLSIIDLAGGQQPVWNEARDVAVIYNGELYNYRELRERLTLLGHHFSTQSDTEILVHGWEEWGEECLAELRGMFAFALLDLRGRFATAPLLFLARDPLGIKPLLHPVAGRLCVCVGSARSAGQRHRAETDFAGRADFLPVVWQHFRTRDVTGGSFFAA